MIKLFFNICTLSLLILSAGCGDDDPVNSTEAGTITISGKIDGWNGDEDKTLYASDHHFNYQYFDLNHSLGAGKVSADGSFNMTISEPHKLMLDSLVKRFPRQAFTSGVHLFSPGAKYCELDFYVGKKDSIIGNVYIYGQTSSYISDYNGDYYVDYIYIDTAAVINGTYNYNFLGTQETVYFDINFKQGWNRYTHYYQTSHIDKYMSEEMGESKFKYNNWPNKFPIVD